MKYQRLKKDIADIMKCPLNDNGIYYAHDESNILRGYILMCGPPDTPYENGFYFFIINFPENYPVEPPKITFCNNDSVLNTRFNPNLYRNGKVCISILNTWRGEGWTSCLTLKTVLLSILSVLNNNPLINEPHIDITHSEVIPYNIIITNRNIDVCIYDIINKTIHNKGLPIYSIFKSTLIQLFLKKFEKIETKLKSLIKTEYNQKSFAVNTYNMTCFIDYNEIYDNIKKIKIELDKL